MFTTSGFDRPKDKPGTPVLAVRADALAETIAARRINPLPNRSRVATLQMADPNRFRGAIRRLYDVVREQLATVLGDDPAARIEQLVQSLADWNTAEVQKLGLAYPFERDHSLKKQRLFIRSEDGKDPLLRLHKLSITVRDAAKLSDNLIAGLRAWFQEEFDGYAEEADWTSLEEILATLSDDPTGDLAALRTLLDKESLGQLKQEAQVRYLDYLAFHHGPAEGEPPVRGYELLTDLRRRLRLLTEYLANPDRPDGDFMVRYLYSSPYNLRDLFGRSDAFDPLPVITLIEGALGTSTNPETGTRTFTFGVKLKLNGAVSSEGTNPPKVWPFRLDQMTPGSAIHDRDLAGNEERFKRKVLQLAFLLHFVFDHFGDLTYDPVTAWERDYLPGLQGDDPTAQSAALTLLRQRLDTKQTASDIGVLCKWLRQKLKQTTRRPEYIQQLHLVVQRGILQDDLDRLLGERTFFRPVLRKQLRDALRYVVIRDSRVSREGIAKLAVTLSFQDLPYFEASPPESFRMSHQVGGIQALPVLMSPYNLSDQDKRKIRAHFDPHPRISIPYKCSTDTEKVCLDDPNQPAAAKFRYRFTYSLIAYLTLLAILEYREAWVFLPILRFHRSKKEKSTEQETFVRALSRTLAHLLSDYHGSNAQGFNVADILKGGNTDAFLHRLENGLSSLYSVLPKRFNCPAIRGSELNYLAIVVVSSRECDRHFKSDEKRSTLMGEVISIIREDPRHVTISPLHTFTGSYSERELFRRPTVLMDTVHHLYEQGYRHIMYVALAPYSSTLHLTGEGESELFFMSPEVIAELKAGHPDLKLYPVFYEKYSVVKLREVAQALYIQDTTELTEVARDPYPERRQVIFFNLFNGITVGKADDSRFYNGVISYVTLQNMYRGDVLADEDIYLGLLADTPLKRELLQYLTLFHFSRYEAARRTISLKLDPYENLIGDKSVGKDAVFPHADRDTRWNAMAFLGEVGGIVAAYRRGEEVE